MRGEWEETLLFKEFGINQVELFRLEEGLESIEVDLDLVIAKEGGERASQRFVMAKHKELLEDKGVKGILRTINCGSVWKETKQQRKDTHFQLLECIVQERVHDFFQQLERREGKQPLNINFRFQSEWTFLHHAAMSVSLAMVARIVNYPDTQLDARTGAGETALHIGAKHNRLETCQLLLAAGIPINAQDCHESTALHYAVELGHREMVVLLLKNGADTTIPDQEGITPSSVLDNNHSPTMRHHLRDREQVSILLTGEPLKLLKNQQSEKKGGGIQQSKAMRRGQIQKEKITHFLKVVEGRLLNEGVSLQTFTFHRLLGKGNFGEVYLVKRKTDSQLFALKALLKERVVGHSLERYIRGEKEILCRVEHPFVVRLHYSFQTQTHLFLVMEYCSGGSLARSLRRKRKGFEEHVVRSYACELLLAVGGLHRAGVVHRDLKPENLVLDSEGHLMVTDFGLSRQSVGSDDLTTSVCGTPLYLPVEVINKSGHNRMVDWYSFGVVLYELYAGVPPYCAQTHSEVYNLIKEGNLRFPRGTPPLLRDLLRRLLHLDALQRLGANGDSDAIQCHPWFDGVDWHSVLLRRLQMPSIENPPALPLAFIPSFLDTPSIKGLPGWTFYS